MNRIAVFASGSGTNAQNIAEYFKFNKNVIIDCILSNNPEAYVLERAKNLDISTMVFSRQEFYHSSKVIRFLKERKIDFIILAGFLWLIPENILEAYPNRMINIHPALLPKYGGKGMYGMNVHKAVVEAKEKESGITIHFVNNKYDEGKIIFQAKCDVLPEDTPEEVAGKIHELEHKYFPKVIEDLLDKS